MVKTLNPTIALPEMERILQEDLGRTNQAINEIQRQIDEVNHQRQSLSAPVLTKDSDPIEEAHAQIKAEKRLQDLTAQERALYATLERYTAQATEARQELAKIQLQRDTSAAQALIDDVNAEMVKISDEITKLRDRQRKLLTRAYKLANQPQVGKALSTLGIRSAYIDIWLTDRAASSFDAPNLGKMGAGMAFVSGDALKDHPSSQGWVIVSQAVFGSKDVK